MATRKSTSRGSSSRSKGSAKKNAAQKRAKRQMHAILLFAIGLLTGALALVKGASVWTGLHNTLFGLFGVGAPLVAILLIYLAILLTMDKPVKARAWLCSLLILCVCAAWQIFKMDLANDARVLDLIVDCFSMGVEVQSGGLFGAILGLPLALLFGKVGAGILIVLLIFIFMMLLTGGTLIGLARAAHQPVRKIQEVYTDQMMKQEERAQQRQQNPPPPKPARARGRHIDIPLDGEALPEPATPSLPEKTATLPPKPAAAPSAPAVETAGAAAPAATAVAEPEDAQTPKFEIDIPLDDNFKSDGTGGFSLHLAEEPMQFVPAEEPTLDELVSKAATKTGRFAFDAADAGASAQETENSSGLHLNLPPDIDLVDSGLYTPDGTPTPKKAAIDVPVPDTAPPQPREDPGKADEGIQTELSAQISEPPKPVYRTPPVELLCEPRVKNDSNVSEELKNNAQRLVDTLASFGVQTRIVDISRGPAVTRYELQPSAGVKISKITGLADDIALNLAAAGVRIEAPIPNKAAVGIEVPNKEVCAVTLREIIDSDTFRSAKSKLSVALGRDIAGNVTIADIAKMPHLLIAGSTGSGKSVCINSIIMSLLFQSKPDEVRFLMIDPKVVELGVYNGIPQLLVPVVTDPKKAAGALSWAVSEMLKRYKLFADNSVRDLNSFNNLAARTEGMEQMPQIVIIIDELADLMMAAPNEIEDYICRLAQMARAAGMHLIIATQRPSVDVITGVIKANIPSRIAFAVSSQIDSRTILDMGGAEKLLGRGDMLFNPVGAAKPIRVQGCFVTDEEIESVISFIKNDATAKYDEQIVHEIDTHVVAGKGGKGASSSSADSAASDDSNDDEMLMPAIECVVEAGMASTSLLQRRLKLGYARAARIVDEMEARGIVGPFEGSKPRQVLISPERLAELKLSQQNQ